MHECGKRHPLVKSNPIESKLKKTYKKKQRKNGYFCAALVIGVFTLDNYNLRFEPPFWKCSEGFIPMCIHAFSDFFL